MQGSSDRGTDVDLGVGWNRVTLPTREGDCLAANLGPGNVHSADGWEEVLLPEIERQQGMEKEVVFRADAAFAKPEVYEALEARGGSSMLQIYINKRAHDYIVQEVNQLEKNRGSSRRQQNGSSILPNTSTILETWSRVC